MTPGEAWVRFAAEALTNRAIGDPAVLRTMAASAADKLVVAAYERGCFEGSGVSGEAFVTDCVNRIAARAANE